MSRKELTLDAAAVKAGLRRRHPAEQAGSMVGQWTCIEEWEQVDLIALNAWADADVIGYEVKVSRSDYRQELLAPAKRADAVAMCTEFYFAVPAGLLKPDEIAYEEPEWEPEDWHRMRCPGVEPFGPPSPHARRRHQPTDLLDAPPGRYGGQCRGRGRAGSLKAGSRRERGPFTLTLPLPVVATDVPEYVGTRYQRIEGSRDANGIWKSERVRLDGPELEKELSEWAHHRTWDAEHSVPCPTCNGKGYLAKSRVEAEAPTLWVPRDVGLIEVTERGSRVVRRSPKRRDAPGLLPVEGARSPRRARQQIAHLVRWTSNRPDPRHVDQLTRRAVLNAA